MSEVNQDASLNVQDLSILLKAIDVATERGGFKANEMANVGSAYNRVSAFVAAVVQKQQIDQAAAESAENTASEKAEG